MLGQYLRGQLLVMLMMAAFYSVGLALFGFELAVPVGVFTGLAMFVPYVGFGIGALLALLAGVLQFAGWYGPLAVVVVYGTGQVVEGFFLTPRLVGQRIGMSPITVIFALLAFGHLFGFVGVLVALPASALIAVGRGAPARELHEQQPLHRMSVAGPPQDAKAPSGGSARREPQAWGPHEADPAGDRAGAGADLRELPARRQRRGDRPPARRWRPARRRSTSGARPAAARRICCRPLVEPGATRKAARRLVLGAPTAPPWDDGERARLARLDDAARARRRAAAGGVLAASSTRPRAAPASSPPAALPPVDLDVREDLRTRLGWGHVFALAPLGEAEVRAALRREADRRGIFLSDEVMDYLLTRFARDLKHLMAQLDRLDAFSLSTKRAITVPLLEADAGGRGAAPGTSPCSTST